ncbi:MAG: polyphosphate kinase 1 [Bacteroidota bacterium]
MTQDKPPSPTAPSARYLSRDLSWLAFNERVLDQATSTEKTLAERLRFLAISAAHLDEFFMIRVGRLYNYLDYNRTWTNQLGLEARSFLHRLLQEARAIFLKQHKLFLGQLYPALETRHLTIVQDLTTLSRSAEQQLRTYFEQTLLPVLSPKVVGGRQAFPALPHSTLIWGIATRLITREKPTKQLSFVQILRHLPRFYRLHQDNILVPVEAIIRQYLPLLFPHSVMGVPTLFRITRNGNFSWDESDDIEANFVEELKRKLKRRKQGRVVRLELAGPYDPWLVERLQRRWTLGPDNLLHVPASSLPDLSGLQALEQPSSIKPHLPVPPLVKPAQGNLPEVLKHQDILLHYPYNSMDTLLDLLNQAAEDPQVTTMKITIYRLAPQSAVVTALLKAAAQGKQVVVVMEIKARFDEEHNIREAQKLEEAGCQVIYGVNKLKTHAKMLMIVREEEGEVTRYVHLATGNYNEETARGYADVSLLTTEEGYAHDVAAFFDVLTGYTGTPTYTHLITSPLDMRAQLTGLIQQEVQNARQGLPAGIVIKVNALEDEAIIEELYKASAAGVPIRLIVRGVCCLIPQKPGLSDNITVRSIVGNFLEHSRLFYFHQQGTPKVYAGSADMMVRSFDKRIEALFILKNPVLQQQVIHILACNLKDNVNSYLMQADGTYSKKIPGDEPLFNMHESFFNVNRDEMMKAKLFA